MLSEEEREHTTGLQTVEVDLSDNTDDQNQNCDEDDSSTKQTEIF